MWLIVMLPCLQPSLSLRCFFFSRATASLGGQIPWTDGGAALYRRPRHQFTLQRGLMQSLSASPASPLPRGPTALPTLVLFNLGRLLFSSSGNLLLEMSVAVGKKKKVSDEVSRSRKAIRDSERQRERASDRERERERPETMSYPSAEDVAASLPHFDDAVKYING